jgi:hypothetical protein
MSNKSRSRFNSLAEFFCGVVPAGAEQCGLPAAPYRVFLPWMRSACRAQSTPARRTHARPSKFASRLSGFGLLPPRQAWVPFRKTSSVALGVGRAGTPSGQACTAPSGKSLHTGATKCTIAHFSSAASVTTLKPKRGTGPTGCSGKPTAQQPSSRSFEAGCRSLESPPPSPCPLRSRSTSPT